MRSEAKGNCANNQTRIEYLMIFEAFVGVVVAMGAYAAVYGGRGLLFALMNAYRSAAGMYLRLRGTDAKVSSLCLRLRMPLRFGVGSWIPDKSVDLQTEVEKRIVSGEAWSEWCDAMKAAGTVVLSPGCPTDPFTQAEGYRYLSRLARVSLENFVECSSTDAPQLVALANGSRAAPVHIGSDNPDNVYENANLDGRKQYRLHVKRGTVHFLSFGTQSGQYGGPGGLRTVDYKEASEFDQGSNGDFEIFISKEKPDNMKNWLKLVDDPPEALLIVRQTREDHENEILAEVKIECVSGSNKPKPLTAGALDEGLRRSSLFVAFAPFLFAKWARDFQQHVNQLPLFDQKTSDSVGGDPSIRYYHSYWKLDHNETLVITTKPPKCKTWNFQLNNHWMEALDYRYHNIHVNKFYAKCLKDGSVIVVVSTHDPNKLGLSTPFSWIETTGHKQGTMCWRWVHPETDENLPQPRTNVVKYNDLAAFIEKHVANIKA